MTRAETFLLRAITFYILERDHDWWPLKFFIDVSLQGKQNDFDHRMQCLCNVVMDFDTVRLFIGKASKWHWKNQQSSQQSDFLIIYSQLSELLLPVLKFHMTILLACFLLMKAYISTAYAWMYKCMQSICGNYASLSLFIHEESEKFYCLWNQTIQGQLHCVHRQVKWSSEISVPQNPFFWAGTEGRKADLTCNHLARAGNANIGLLF